ncbi:polysaccharide deacetylase family protein [Agathobaculum sp.]|uniref:polysaccharide deacetylase family protein n=2 Tax=Agathobaculum sp. TaxID=2048138 RepID=UPI003AB806BD
MAYGTANSYARPRRRRRKRKSHYGVLALVIVLLIALIVLAVKLVTTAVSTVLGRTETHEIVYQVDNKLGYCDGKTFDLEAAPYRDQSGNLFAPLQSLCDALQIDLTWDESTKSGTAVWNKQTAEIKASSTKVQMGEESRNMAAAPSVKDGVVFIPAKDFCAAFSWKTAETAEEQGDLLIISQKDDELTEDAIKQITDDVTKVLGPSEKQITGDSILMRTDSDKALVAGETRTMASDGEKLGEGVMEQNGTKYVPLKAAMTALGGTAEFDGKKTWTVKYNDTETTVTTNGKFKIDGNRVKGDDFTVWLDEEKDRFYVSAPALAQIIGRNYTDLGDGAFAFTTLSLDGLDSQKTYLDSLRSSLSDAVDGDIPEADVYIALTFDDGPTGKIENYPNGLTNYLLDGLKERGAKATFLMVGNRVSEVSDVLPRMVNEGHELGNHTMTHPMCHLTGLDEDGIRSQINDATEAIKAIAGQPSQVLRPVGGGVNSDVKAVAKELGYPIINWSVDTEDWKYRDAEHVKQVIVEQAGDGDVVLMHDLYPTSVQGALAAIDELQARTDKTYAFVTVSQLAAIHGITLEPGVVYNGLSSKVAQEIQDGTYSPAEFT